jgi:disulfide bond formation protein DsbB
MVLPRTRTIAVLCALAAAFALGLALAAERWLGLAPCELCLWERWPYRLAIVLGLVAAMLPRPIARLLLGLVMLTILADGAIAFVHVGVEQHYWVSPLPECAAPHITAGSIADRLAQMPARPAKPCDDPSFLIPFLPLSMAALNLMFAFAFAAFLAAYLWISRGRQT